MRSRGYWGYTCSHGHEYQGDAGGTRTSLGRIGRSSEIRRMGRRGKEVRGSEGNWPSKAARFHHTVGVWPFHIRDQTTVVESDRPHRLVLQAKVRPIGSARIALELSPSASGTQVAMTEEPCTPSIARMARRLFDPVIFVRNGEALRRLENLVRKVDP